MRKLIVVYLQNVKKYAFGFFSGYSQSKRNETMNDEPKTQNTDDLISFHAWFITERIVLATAEHFGFCPGCLGREVIRQLEAQLARMNHEPDDEPDDEPPNMKAKRN